MDTPRRVPPNILAKYGQWRAWQEVFGWLHVVIGSISVGCSVVIGANAAQKFISDTGWTVFLSVVSAVATFVLTFINSRQKNEAFERAARELEKAMALYQLDPEMSEIELAKAEIRGIDLLNEAKPG